MGLITCKLRHFILASANIPIEEIGDRAHVVCISDITLNSTNIDGSQPHILHMEVQNCPLEDFPQGPLLTQQQQGCQDFQTPGPSIQQERTASEKCQDFTLRPDLPVPQKQHASTQVSSKDQTPAHSQLRPSTSNASINNLQQPIRLFASASKATPP